MMRLSSVTFLNNTTFTPSLIVASGPYSHSFTFPTLANRLCSPLLQSFLFSQPLLSLQIQSVFSIASFFLGIKRGIFLCFLDILSGLCVVDR